MIEFVASNAWTLLCFVLAIVSAILASFEDGRLAKHLRLNHPDAWKSEEIQNLFVDDERFTKFRKKFLRGDHSLKRDDAEVAKLCRSIIRWEAIQWTSFCLMFLVFFLQWIPLPF